MMWTRRSFIKMGAAAIACALPFPSRAFAIDKQIAIQPLEPYDSAAIPVVRASLEEIFSYAVAINPPRPVPEHAKDARRGRYHAPTIVETLGDKLTLAITDVDICQPNNHPEYGSIPDWGVIGVAALGGPAGVISTHRIRDPRWLPYVVVHETGHLRGLDHCANERCQMLDVQGDAKKYLSMRYGWFCERHNAERHDA